MILCVGTSGSGKSTLLRHLQIKNGQASSSANKKAKAKRGPEDEAPKAPATVPTVGTNLVALSRPHRGGKRGGGGGGQPVTDEVVIREVGGSMAPLWNSYIEPGKTRFGLLFAIVF